MPTQRLVLSLVLIYVFAASDIAFGQFPEPKPNQAHQVFAADEGTWVCEINMYLNGPDADPVKYKGEEVNKLVCGGLYLQSEFRAKMGDRMFEGHALMGYHAKSKKYEGTWVDSFTSSPSRLTAVFDEKKKTLTATGIVQDENGNDLKQKQVTTWIDDSTKTLEIFLVLEIGDQQRDVRLMDMKAKRTSAAND